MNITILFLLHAKWLFQIDPAMTISHFSLEYLDNRAPQIRASLNERRLAMRP